MYCSHTLASLPAHAQSLYAVSRCGIISPFRVDKTLQIRIGFEKRGYGLADANQKETANQSDDHPYHRTGFGCAVAWQRIICRYFCKHQLISEREYSVVFHCEGIKSLHKPDGPVVALN